MSPSPSALLPSLLLPVRSSVVVFKSYLIHFYTERIWALRFTVVEASTWLLSLELGEHSPPVGVNADLLINGPTSDRLETRDSEDPLTISFGPTTSMLRPGHENAIAVRLDDGPIGPHLLNEYVNAFASLCHRLIG